MHFGIICPPVPGHIHPFGALARELIERGHRVSFIHMADLAPRALREGAEFIAIGQADHPEGSLAVSLAALGTRHGLAALRFTIAAVAQTTEMMLRDAPAAITTAGIEALLVDQMEPAGCAIAERLELPFFTVCNALALNRESSVPPPFTPWSYSPAWWARARNRIGYAIADRLTSRIAVVVNRYRKGWDLKAHTHPEESFSPLAQISQQPKAFDFPRQHLPSTFHYVGPLRKQQPAAVPFPWERLDGRPLVYASLGTLQNSRLPLFRCFAESCEGLDVQLVMTHGGGLSESDVQRLPAGPLVVSYAPQPELISRASLTLTHAGLNTVLDSLSFGVPVVAVPITYEQPAIAERLRYTGAGDTMGLSGLNPERLRKLIARVLEGESYRSSAAAISDSIRTAGGTSAAADRILAVGRN